MNRAKPLAGRGLRLPKTSPLSTFYYPRRNLVTTPANIRVLSPPCPASRPNHCPIIERPRIEGIASFSSRFGTTDWCRRRECVILSPHDSSRETQQDFHGPQERARLGRLHPLAVPAGVRR